MCKLRFIITGVLCCLLAATGASAQTDKARIEDVLARFKTALSTGNFENAIRYTDSSTLAYYDSLAKEVQEADSATVAGLPLFRRLLILSFRHRDTNSVIRSYNGKELLTFAMAHDMVSDGNIIGDSIHTVIVNGQRASAMTTFLEDGDSLQLHLVKAHGSWKVNLVGEIADAARLVEQLQLESGRSETEFIFGLLEHMTGSRPTPAIWRKPV